MDRVLTAFDGAGEVVPRSEPDGRGHVGLLDPAADLVEQLLLERLGVREGGGGVVVLRLEVGEDGGVVPVAKPEPGIDAGVTVRGELGGAGGRDAAVRSAGTSGESAIAPLRGGGNGPKTAQHGGYAAATMPTAPTSTPSSSTPRTLPVRRSPFRSR